MKIFNIEFLHLRIRHKFERLLQNLAVLYFCLNAVFIGFFMLFLFIYLLFTKYYFISLLYIAWFIYDRKTGCRGGRRWGWMRRLSFWKSFAAYFPISMVKTAELSPDKNYIFGCHPHGILSFGDCCCFVTEATNFSEEFPGITPYMLTLDEQFWLPFHREHIMCGGFCSASKESIEWLLTKEGTGNALLLVIGGVSEVLDSHPGVVTLILKNRKGFAKCALKYGASLVPVFAFGENDVYDQVENPKGTKLRSFQDWLRKSVGYSLPLFHGRDDFFLLPHRKPITVVSKPIDVDKIEEPTTEDILKLHDLYIKSLVNLFEEHKLKYGKDLKLVIT